MTTVNHECYVSLGVAKLLKEAGFDWGCIRYYQNDDETLYGPLVEQYKLVETNFNVAPVYMNQYSAPTLDIAQRWLRELHHLHITIFSSSQESWMFRITKPHQKLEDGVYGEDFYTYEEAQEVGIKKALEVVLEKKEDK